MPHPVPFTLHKLPNSTTTNQIWQVTGVLDAAGARSLDREMRRHWPKSGGAIALDLTEVTAIDSAGAAYLVAFWRAAQQLGVTAALQQVQPTVRAWLDLCRVAEAAPALPPKATAAESLGSAVWHGWESFCKFTVLSADVTVSAAQALLMPHKLRWSALAQQSSLMGSQALGIVGLITFLIGLTLAFQSAYQLRQFGAAIYVASLTAISMVREMGPLITAILVAGRSGSSITSEVATMKVGEEIDALQVMGISFVDFIAVPKLLAMLITVPLLTILADLLGILGGWVVGTVYLDIAPMPYLQKTLDALAMKDLATGLFKSVVFAWGIALIGLFHGIGVRGGAEDVGKATTASVVAAIFFIIVADSVFSVLFYVVLG